MKVIPKLGAIIVFSIFIFVFVLLFFSGSLARGKSKPLLPVLSSQAEENAWLIWCLLGEKGYSEAARAGILGNIDQETGHTFNADIDEYGAGNGYGLIQWTPKSVLLNQLEQSGIRGDYKTIPVQVEVIDWELSGPGRGYIPTKSHPYSFAEFKQLDDVRTAAQTYEKNRERPREDHPERQELALHWYKAFHGMEEQSPMHNDQSDLVKIALKELGNKGGQKFWSWYGYPFRVEWCAVFVSWCADQAGGGDLRFSYCPSEVNRLKADNKWKPGGVEPGEGDIIFFDWESDGISDHVGLVVKCEEGTVYTVEGNSNDEVREQRYPIHSSVIFGYGIR
ncbi:CHAP domain-containing protein [Enterococcus sp. BWB1-3]|uniref:phage tail tip lysozyme n=1 Tax=Enterococcus sp. BWB1-3 TaxID=2787713 RepID=UPI001924E29C|nr:phage tail tip lysozyme [Enterococcus sp. BWB1-3]MBL1228947.1 CHAP domain-containing protein [Enterococcus sp. BWB1-3]